MEFGKLKGNCLCALINEPMEDCFHGVCNIVRYFNNGRILIQNTYGFVRAAYPNEIISVNVRNN